MFTADEMFCKQYEAIKCIARRKLTISGLAARTTLTPGALTNEAYLKMRNSRFRTEAHFRRTLRVAIGSILIDCKRRLNTARHAEPLRSSISVEAVALPERLSATSLLDLHEGVEHLAMHRRREATAVYHRYVLGYSIDETAEAMEVSRRTVKRDCQRGLRTLRHRLA